MRRVCGSYEEAVDLFARFAEEEPQLWALWDLCREASTPTIEASESDERDPFSVDVFAEDKPDEGWCVEDYFHEHVKSPLQLLVGLHRPRGPEQLRTEEAFSTVYNLLLEWALRRCCACCATLESETGSLELR